jgi:uncharacterized protein YaiL (DUF2058 family)
MSDSLKDQLLALGLAKPSSGKNTKPRRNSAGRPKRNPPKGKQPGKAQSTRGRAAQPKDDSSVSLAQAFQLRDKHSKAEAEQAKQKKREENLRRRQLNKEIRSIVEPNRLNDQSAELTRNFMYKGRIRKVNVTAEQFVALNQGELGLVYLAGGYHIMKPEQIKRVVVLSPENVPDLQTSSDEDEEFPVPDDLIW